MLKFEPNAKAGIFLGYWLLNGHYWKQKGGLQVADINQFGGALDPFCEDSEVVIDRVSEAWIPKDEGLHFPMKATFDAKHYTVVPPAVADTVFDLADAPKDGTIQDEKQPPITDVQPKDSVEGGNALLQGGVRHHQ